MAYDEITQLLGGWPGFELVGVRREDATAEHLIPRIVLTLAAVSGHPRRCSRCGEVVEELHDVTPREVRDLPILDAETWLILPRARVRCPRCGPTVEAVPWLDRYQRMTQRLADSIARLCQVLPIKHVAAWFRVGWDTVKHIDKRAVTARLGPIERGLQQVRILAIDEFALHRGRQYATLVADPTTKRVLWVGRGRSREDLRAFFTLLGPRGCATIEAVVMDLFPLYLAEVRAQCPRAAIVADLYHVIARYGEVIDRVRVDEANRLQRPQRDHHRHRTEAHRRVIKGTRWLLLRNHSTLRHGERVHLRELLAANRALFTVYVLKDDLKQLWRFRYPAVARRFWADWYHRAQASGIAAVQRFADRLACHIDYIVNHCRYPLNNGFLEGVNNKIKVLKRMAYGYRDDAYFFLKIRAAFPGNAG